jgi:cell division protein FtsL
MNNARLEMRLLAHSIDAATLSAGRSRKRKTRITSGEKVLLAIVTAISLVFLIGAAL